jgi:hypothetical protein
MDGGKGDFPTSTCVEDRTQTSLQGTTIAAQCCDEPENSHGEEDTDTKPACRRYVGTNDEDGCVAGIPPRAHTFDQAQALCAELGLAMCADSCVGNGCTYNRYPVYTSAPCPFTAQVLDGGKGDHPDSTCVTDPAQTTVNGVTVATQCCDPSDTSLMDGCRRYVGTDDDSGCIGGRDPPRAHTFAQAEALCSAAGLVMCDQSCKGHGCGYNTRLVWTHLPCTPSPTAAPTTSSTNVPGSPPSPPPHRPDASAVPPPCDSEMSLTADAAAGDTRLHTTTVPACVEVGTELLLSEGRANAESIIVAGFGSILIAAPLQFNHSAGASLGVWFSPPPSPPAPPWAPPRIEEFASEQSTDGGSSSAALAALAVLALPIIFLAWAKCRYGRAFCLYLNYLLTHTNPAVTWRYMAAPERDDLWRQIENGAPDDDDDDVFYVTTLRPAHNERDNPALTPFVGAPKTGGVDIRRGFDIDDGPEPHFTDAAPRRQSGLNGSLGTSSHIGPVPRHSALNGSAGPGSPEQPPQTIEHMLRARARAAEAAACRSAQKEQPATVAADDASWERARQAEDEEAYLARREFRLTQGGQATGSLDGRLKNEGDDAPAVRERAGASPRWNGRV